MEHHSKNIVVQASEGVRRFGLAGAVTALPVVLCLASGPAQADGLSIGLGRLGEVSVGRGSLADVDVDVGGLDVEATVADRDSLARGCVGSCDGPGTSVGVSVGSGGVSASVGTGSGAGTPGSGAPGTGSPGTGTPGTGTPGAGTPGTGTPGTGTVRTANELAMTPNDLPSTLRPLTCAGRGNSSVFDGMALVDRTGVQIGEVRDTQLSSELKIMGVAVRMTGRGCVAFSGGSYKVSEDGRMWVNMDAAALR